MTTEVIDFAIADLHSRGEKGFRLVDLLSDGTATIGELDSVEGAVSSNARVLVLHLSRKPRNDPPLESQTLKALRARKVIGIGRGAAQLFGQMDLEICSDRTCDYSAIREPELIAQADGKSPTTFVACRRPVVDGSRPPLDDHIAVFAPAWDEASAIEVIARLKLNLNYGSIVRQDNHTLVGISGPPQTWTQTFRELFTRVAREVLAAPVATQTPRPLEITSPGVCQFALAEGGSLTSRFHQEFSFMFPHPTLFTARLMHEHSSHIMLAFYGTSVSTSSRHDSDSSMQPLETSIVITEEEICAMKDRYWSLHVTNFDSERVAECSLTISYDVEGRELSRGSFNGL